MHFFMEMGRFGVKLVCWSQKRAACAAPYSIPEDMPIDLRVIAIRIEIAQGGETWAA